MKFINREPREPIYLNSSDPEAINEYTLDQKIDDIKIMSNVELKHLKEVAEFNRLEVQLRVYGLEKAGKSYEEETSLLKRIKDQIDKIDTLITANVEDNSLSWEWDELEGEK